MKRMTTAILAATALTSFSAYAGSGCSDANMTYDHHQGFYHPAVTTAEYGNVGNHPFVKVGSYHHSGMKYRGDGMKRQADVVDTAVSSGSFSILVTAVQEAGLVDTLKGDGPFTVFAPTDEAFSKLPPGTLEGLLADREKLVQILTYHVVPGRIMSSDMSAINSLNTVEGSAIAPDSIKVSQADVIASNGVIHAIDEVLIPET